MFIKSCLVDFRDIADFTSFFYHIYMWIFDWTQDVKKVNWLGTEEPKKRLNIICQDSFDHLIYPLSVFFSFVYLHRHFEQIVAARPVPRPPTFGYLGTEKPPLNGLESKGNI